MNKTELLIGYVLRTGLWVSVFIVLVGGILYLLQNGHQFIHYHTLQHYPVLTLSLPGIVHEALSFSARGLIWLGLLILVLTQVVRVALTVLLFVEERDWIFSFISTAILFLLTYSVFWRN